MESTISALSSVLLSRRCDTAQLTWFSSICSGEYVNGYVKIGSVDRPAKFLAKLCGTVLFYLCV